MVSNPVRYRTRYHLYAHFARHMASFPQVRLKTVEVAYGDRAFEVTEAGNPDHLQLRTRDEMWHKENALNVLLRHLPPDWEYAAWVDADVTFTNPEWADEALHRLQHHPAVQLFSHARDLGADGEPIEQDRIGYGFGHVEGYDPGPLSRGGFAKAWHPGYGYAFRRDALDALGGWFDVAITGAADMYCVHTILGRFEDPMFDDHSPGFQHYCRVYRERGKALRGDLGYVPGLVVHHHHGPKPLRQYWPRRAILIDHQFDPYTDLIPDTQGLYRFAGNKPELERALRRYLRARDEDSTAEALWPTPEEASRQAAWLSRGVRHNPPKPSPRSPAS
jgi:hypothetical protein